MYIVMFLYVYDNPESKDLSGLKPENRTNRQCYRLLLLQLDTKECKLGIVGTLGESLKTLDVHNRIERDAKEITEKYSMVSVNLI